MSVDRLWTADAGARWRNGHAVLCPWVAWARNQLQERLALRRVGSQWNVIFRIAGRIGNLTPFPGLLRCLLLLPPTWRLPFAWRVALRLLAAALLVTGMLLHSRGTMLDLCYSETCIGPMGAENNWDDCGLDDTCGKC